MDWPLGGEDVDTLENAFGVGFEAVLDSLPAQPLPSVRPARARQPANMLLPGEMEAEAVEVLGKRPRGRAPKGKRWDGARRCWVSTDKGADGKKAKRTMKDGGMSPASGGTADVASPKTPQPQALAGKKWDSVHASNAVEGGVPRNREKNTKRLELAANNAVISHKRPRGRAPKGKVWDTGMNCWVKDDAAASLTGGSTAKKATSASSRKPASTHSSRKPSMGRDTHDALPEGWRMTVDHIRGIPYYYNVRDRIPQWDRP